MTGKRGSANDDPYHRLIQSIEKLLMREGAMRWLQSGEYRKLQQRICDLDGRLIWIDVPVVNVGEQNA
jgi:hypothetical protein